MKLFTDELVELFKDYPLYSQQDEEDPKVIAKFFDPCGSATWYILELDPVERIAFGYVTGLTADEYGYVSIDELESIERPWGLSIERDLYLPQNQRLSHFIKRNGHG